MFADSSQFTPEQQETGAPAETLPEDGSNVEVRVDVSEDRNTLTQELLEIAEEAYTMPPPTDSRRGRGRPPAGRAAHRGRPLTTKPTSTELGRRFLSAKKRKATSGDESSSSEDGESQVLTKRARPLNLTVEQERDVVEWLQQHDIFYNKKLLDYKDVGKKSRLLQEKAGELNVHGEYSIIYVLCHVYVICDKITTIKPLLFM